MGCCALRPIRRDKKPFFLGLKTSLVIPISLIAELSRGTLVLQKFIARGAGTSNHVETLLENGCFCSVMPTSLRGKYMDLEA